ncbi:MAG: hypothetical protein ABIM88_02160 [candidate division WOR-3 bacterium]
MALNIAITRTVSIQIELDEISIDQPEVWMKLVEEKEKQAGIWPLRPSRG